MQRPDVRRLRAARLWRRRGSVRRSHTRSPPCPPSLSHSRSRSCSSKCSCPCSHSCRPVNKRGALPRSPRNRGRDLSSRTASRLAARPLLQRAKPSHAPVVSVECQQSLLMHGHCSGLSSLSSASKACSCSGLSSLSSASKACSCTTAAVACRLCRVSSESRGRP